ncbi:unnamed protein product [Auanema sp. JU1783]|nr:unnamed protein product [Auanema sp. JU1783]
MTNKGADRNPQNQTTRRIFPEIEQAWHDVTSGTVQDPYRRRALFIVQESPGGLSFRPSMTTMESKRDCIADFSKVMQTVEQNQSDDTDLLEKLTHVSENKESYYERRIERTLALK